jgi:hypothetical protein
MTILASIYMKGGDMAIALIKSEEYETTVLEVWDSSQEPGAIAFIRNIDDIVDCYVINGDSFPSSNPQNLMKELLIASGIDKHIDMQRNFEVCVGKAVLSDAIETRHIAEPDLEMMGFGRWNEASDNSDVPLMAIFQGAIAARLRKFDLDCAIAALQKEFRDSQD